MSYIGVNIGALTVKVAVIRGDTGNTTILAHQGRPLEYSTTYSPAIYGELLPTVGRP